MTKSKDEIDVLPSLNEAKEFYAKYEPKNLLGRGVSSVVRRCIEKESGIEYAVKIIDISDEQSDSYSADQMKKDTLREIEILQMCSGQSHIIELYDTFETPTYIFLVFELCKNGELFDYLTQVVCLSEKRTRQIMRQLLESVKFVHSRNIVHRDLKPENILLDDNLNVKLSDFGLAIFFEENKELTDLCGTPGYLAPELLTVAMHENVAGYGKEVDLWACGVIMFTLLCGSPPFWHRKQIYMLRAIMECNYEFGSPEWNDVSSDPKDLISKLLVLDPKMRLTAEQALVHPFFKRETAVYRKFYPKRVFKAAVICVQFFYRLNFFYYNPQPVSAEAVVSNPYSVKQFRKLIDGCAFKVYGHWVKRGENQNRAALFEHLLRDDWKHIDD